MSSDFRVALYEGKAVFAWTERMDIVRAHQVARCLTRSQASFNIIPNTRTLTTWWDTCPHQGVLMTCYGNVPIRRVVEPPVVISTKIEMPLPAPVPLAPVQALPAVSVSLLQQTLQKVAKLLGFPLI